MPCRAARVLTSASLPAPRPLSLFSVPSVAWLADVCDALWFLGHRVFSSRPRDGGRRRWKDAEASAAPAAPSPVQAASFLSWGGRASEQEQARHAYVYVARRSPPAALRAPCSHLRRRRRRCQSPPPRLPPHMDMDVDVYMDRDIAMCRVVPRDAQSAKKGKGG